MIDVVRRIIDRLNNIEREMPRLRKGVVTTASPLAVELGDSDVSYTSVTSLTTHTAGENVACLVRGNSILVLGPLSGGTNRFSTGSTTATWTASATSNAATISHGLGATPTSAFAILAHPTGRFSVTVTALTSTQASFVASQVDGTAFSGSATLYWVCFR